MDGLCAVIKVTFAVSLSVFHLTFPLCLSHTLYRERAASGHLISYLIYCRHSNGKRLLQSDLFARVLTFVFHVVCYHNGGISSPASRYALCHGNSHVKCENNGTNNYTTNHKSYVH